MCAYMYNILCFLITPAKVKILLQQLLTFENSCASPMLFKSDHLPINSCARKRENLHIVIVGNSNLLSREAHSNPCAFSCGLTKMSLSGWHYLLFSTSACLQPCQCRGNVSAVPSAVGWQQWRGVQDRQWPDRLRLAVRVLGRLM